MAPLTAPFNTQKFSSRVVISVLERVDAHNFEQLRSQIENMINEGELFLVVDLEQAHFLSLPTIKYLADVAARIGKKGGSLALLTPSEKLKRQIHIYATLADMKLFRSRQDLERDGGEPVPFEPQSPQDSGEAEDEISGII